MEPTPASAKPFRICLRESKRHSVMKIELRRLASNNDGMGGEQGDPPILGGKALTGHEG
jgi:hypothetical protein